VKLFQGRDLKFNKHTNISAVLGGDLKVVSELVFLPACELHAF
jgi:hypothetical protein